MIGQGRGAWTLALLVSAFVVAGPGGAASAQSMAQPMAQPVAQPMGSPWSRVPSPNPGGLRDAWTDGVSCPKAGACVAVGSLDSATGDMPLVERQHGTTWTREQAPRAANGWSTVLHAVSCRTTSLCLAVGEASTGPGRPANPFSARWNGASWSVLPMPSLGAGTTAQLRAIDCRSATDCTAVGAVAHTTDFTYTYTLVLHFNGKKWSLVPSPNRASSDYNVLYGVSCTSSSACIAVGVADIDFQASTLVERWNGTHWTEQVSANISGGDNFLQGVSCTSATSCSTVGFVDSGGDSRVLIEHLAGSAWVLDGAPSGPSTALNGVSCTASLRCVAVGVGPNGRAVVERQSGAAWSAVSLPHPSTDAPLSGVDCVSTSVCVAAGGEVSAPVFLQWSGGTWSLHTAARPASTLNAMLRSVSCTSATACMAVGNEQPRESVSVPFAERWNGTAWIAVPIGPDDGTIVDGLAGVACPSANSCFAVGTSINKTLIEHWDGAHWKVQTSVNPGNALTYRFLGIACTSASDCTAVGDANFTPLIEHWNGSTWSVRTAAGPADGGTLDAVSCTSSSSCVAVGYSAGEGAVTEQWDGHVWTLQDNPDVSVRTNLNAVSCVTPTDCTATGETATPSFNWTTRILHWNGHVWTVAATGSADENFASLDGVRCFTATNCIAVGQQQPTIASPTTTLIERWNGASWSTVSSPNDPAALRNRLHGLSCPTAAKCIAVGERGYEGLRGSEDLATLVVST